MRVHLIPCGDKFARKHYKDTIKKLVSIETIKEFDENGEVSLNLKDDSYACWGVTNGKKNINFNRWMKMNPGDICLMYRDKTFFSAGKIIHKFKNRNLSEYLWNSKEDGETWENMFLIDEIKKIDIPISNFIDIMGYKEKYYVQSYTVYDEDISEIIVEDLDLTSWDSPFYTLNCESEEDKRKRIEELMSKLHSTDKKGKETKRRLEQSLLREYHLKKTHTNCSLCHKFLPNSLIHIGHIWKRSQIKDEKIRKNLDIAMPVCKLGCDDLFEKEFIIVNSMGQILRNDKKNFTDELKKFTQQYNGKKCLHFSDKTQDFFNKRYE